MGAKGQAQALAAMSNNYKLVIPLLPEIFFTRIGELDHQVVMAEMPDKTMQTTGQSNPGEFEAEQMMHHTAERAALEAMLKLTETGTLGYKTSGILYYLGADNSTVKLPVLIDGLVVKGRKTPEVASGDDGTALTITWSFSYDNLAFVA